MIPRLPLKPPKTLLCDLAHPIRSSRHTALYTATYEYQNESLPNGESILSARMLGNPMSNIESVCLEAGSAYSYISTVNCRGGGNHRKIASMTL